MKDSIEPTPATDIDVSPSPLPEQAWQQMEGEPWLWYQRFIKYYIPQGPGRSIYKAYETMVATEHPEVAAARRKKKEEEGELTTKKSHNVTDWSKNVGKWFWRERAKAYDRFTMQSALAQVDLARLTLLGAANVAAMALKEALSNERLKVAAAKEILDRAGLPGTTNVGIGPADKFNADELAQAESELDEWESQPQSPRLESSG